MVLTTNTTERIFKHHEKNYVTGEEAVVNFTFTVKQYELSDDECFWLLIKNHITWFPSVQPCNWVGFRISLSLSREGSIFWDKIENFFLALIWRDEIEIIIWPFSYFETRKRLHIVFLVFRDEVETLDNHFLWLSEKKWSLLSSRIPGIENSRWTLGEGPFSRFCKWTSWIKFEDTFIEC